MKAIPPAMRIGLPVYSSTNHLVARVKATMNQMTRLTAPKMI
jgi:hypothetical protein